MFVGLRCPNPGVAADLHLSGEEAGVQSSGGEVYHRSSVGESVLVQRGNGTGLLFAGEKNVVLGGKREVDPREMNEGDLLEMTGAEAGLLAGTNLLDGKSPNLHEEKEDTETPNYIKELCQFFTFCVTKTFI